MRMLCRQFNAFTFSITMFVFGALPQALVVILVASGVCLVFSMATEEAEETEGGPGEPFVAVGWCLDLVQADLARAALEGSGMEARLGDVNVASWFPHLAASAGSIKVKVREGEAGRGREILREVRESIRVRCPVCGSEAIKATRFGHGQPGLAIARVAASLLLSWILLRQFPLTYVCRECGHVWEREEPQGH